MDEALVQLVNALPVAVVVFDATGAPVVANPLANRLLGMSLEREGDLPAALGAFVSGTEDPYPDERTPVARALLGERTTVDDIELRRPEGPRRIRASGAPIVDSEGRIAYVVAVFNDVSEHTVLHAVSHELNSPLATIQALAHVLEEDGEAEAGRRLDDEERLRIVRRLGTTARKTNRLLKDLLDLDRLMLGVLEPKREEIDVADLVKAVAEESRLADERPVHLELEPALALADRVQVERIVDNLLENVRRHTPEGTSVWITVATVDDGAMIAVEDAGAGVPDAEKTAIFQAFRRTPGTEEDGGLGIGLSLVRRFAELHGGRAWVEDRPGGGASFRVLLPAVEESR